MTRDVFAEIASFDQKVAKSTAARIKSFVTRRVRGKRAARMRTIVDAAVSKSLTDRKALAALQRAHGRPSAPKKRATKPRPSSARTAARLKSLPMIQRALAKRGLVVRDYLDIGCSEGGLTAAFGEAFGLAPDHIHGSDIREIDPHGRFTFARADAAALPYPDDTFQLVTLNMALHHFTDVGAVLAEVRRVLVPGGVVAVREHDCRDRATAAFLDLVHDIYAVVLGVEMTLPELLRRRSEVHGTYRTLEGWTDAFQRSGYRAGDAVLTGDAFDSFHAVYLA